ncbi:hypothetical protein BKA62DRAFT_721336 [Auriculariales sp. MPI-PUGE-AT-0066]|nr:hypothetical protein BKA62DRAFT_721336 [Auriculariales sp. MPI-PUGE-AT-0066]
MLSRRTALAGSPANTSATSPPVVTKRDARIASARTRLAQGRREMASSAAPIFTLTTRTRIMAQIPPELLELVFDSLDSNELVEMTHVCSRWRALALDHKNCCRDLTLWLGSWRHPELVGDDWNTYLQRACDTSIPISLSIRVYSVGKDDPELTFIPPSMEAAFGTLAEIMHLVVRLVVVSPQPILTEVLLAALCAARAPRLRLLDVDTRGYGFGWPADIFANSAPRLQILHISETYPPRMLVAALSQITTLRIRGVSDADIWDVLPVTFPNLRELDLCLCEIRRRNSSPLSLSLRRLKVAQFYIGEALGMFDTSSIPRISVVTPAKLRAVPKQLLAGISSSGLHLLIFSWVVPSDGIERHESELIIEDQNRQLRRDISSPSFDLDLRANISSLVHRLTKLTIAHSLLEQLLAVAVVLSQLETLTISLRSFTVNQLIFCHRKCQLLVMHDGNGLASDREPKGTHIVDVKAIELALLAEYLGIGRRCLVLELCGVRLAGEEEDMALCLSLFKND